MKLANFTFIVTDDCNYQCSYCPQKKEEKFITVDLIKKAVDFFYPLLENPSTVVFYGGEPLICFEKIKEAVLYLKKKNSASLKKKERKQIDFSMTTNGSLLTEEIFEFLNLHRFSVLLSFDGLAHNISRKKNDFETILSLIEKAGGYSQVNLEINSVFTPGTIGCLSESIRMNMELGVKEIYFSLSIIEEWDNKALLAFEHELSKVVELLVSNYKKTGSIPVPDFRTVLQRRQGPHGPRLFHCCAAKNRMAITPEGKLWGCNLFHDYFKGKEKAKDYSKYFLGDLDYFIDHYQTVYPEILSNYYDLRIDNFSTGKSYCFLCSDIESCEVCPVNAAYASSAVKKIPGWMCKINKIKNKAKKMFHKKIKK
jgi:sulfatase maturation enzyme AslB (radical SAM superfamily)